mmetsp:Transcript_5620/g.8280  ORF Transcript_5620/g.8280 Transcript_5620/m.8280 type:complete len:102 (-) Transcript_5620:228-533(-)|eukprot:CAMPEP_0172432636 /NCGR_PEP_ID=MMETSP1064-20121228/64335_1 /TAXON_ID=202472 /ORGANISM="Aulacoseira subarctica , Strain CCAP 1002/5" /LENGTH=101 /DNA_ID=CAMNT_0013180099 /DNA_START=20 /DNA_END=325 /DNA_ORIENTATION=+
MMSINDTVEIVGGKYTGQSGVIVRLASRTVKVVVAESGRSVWINQGNVKNPTLVDTNDPIEDGGDYVAGRVRELVDVEVQRVRQSLEMIERLMEQLSSIRG